MNFTQLRHYIEISSIIKSVYLEIKEFKKLFSLSDYEYKNDLLTLKEMQVHYGIELDINQSDDSVFYRISNNEKFKYYYPFFNDLYYRYLNNKTYSKRIINNCIICWTLLDSPNPVSTSFISDNLGYTRSGIRNCLTWCRDFFKGYNLSYVNVPHYGVQIRGNEFYKRLAYIGINNSIDPRLIIGLDKHLIYNDDSSEQLKNLNQIIHEICFANHIQISYINSKLLALYLVIQHNRINKGFMIQDQFEHEKDVEKTYEYQISKNLLSKLYPDQKLNHNELVFLSVLLITMTESLNSPQLNHFFYYPSLLKSEIQQVEKELFSLLNDNYGLIFRDSLCMHAIKMAIQHIVVKHHFKMTNFKGFSLSGRSYAAVHKPLLLMMRNDIMYILESKFNIKSQKSNLIELIDVIQRTIQFTEIKFPKKHLCIMSHLSVNDSRLLLERIKNTYQDLFFDDYRIQTDTSSIDISSANTIYIANYMSYEKKERNVYILDRHHNDISDLKRFLVLNNHFSEAYIDSLSSCHLSSNEETLFEDLNIKPSEYVPIIRNRMMFLINTHHHGKAKIKIVQLNEKIPVNDSDEINQLVLLDFLPNADNLHLFDLILAAFVTDPSLFKRLIQNPEIKELNSYLTHLFHL